MTDWIAFLQKIIEQSDVIALQYFKSAKLGVKIKGDKTPVSDADLAIENCIRELVKTQQPELSILGEEYGETITNSGVKLIIDPIDGTKNFIAGLPHFATLLAIEDQGEVIAGLVSSPAIRDVWWAQKGKGSYHTGRAIHVSDIRDIHQALAFHGSLFGSEASDNPDTVMQLLKKSYRQRGFGDYYQHMLVAMGCGEFAFDFKLKPWDIASLKIIVEEAGGQFSDTSGNDSIYSGTVITSNGYLHAQVQRHLNGLK